MISRLLNSPPLRRLINPLIEPILKRNAILSSANNFLSTFRAIKHFYVIPFVLRGYVAKTTVLILEDTQNTATFQGLRMKNSRQSVFVSVFVSSPLKLMRKRPSAECSIKQTSPLSIYRSLTVESLRNVEPFICSAVLGQEKQYYIAPEVRIVSEETFLSRNYYFILFRIESCFREMFATNNKYTTLD